MSLEIKENSMRHKARTLDDRYTTLDDVFEWDSSPGKQDWD